jgi:hypothetical protein
MNKLAFILASVFISLSIYGQTDVGGVISSNITWTKVNSPYNVTGNILVTNGTTLTIEPGVVIDFQGAYYLEVNGILNAVGAVNDSIYFQGDSWGDNFKGINLNGHQSIIKYAVIQGATQDEAVIWVDNSRIENCRITDMLRGIMAINGGTVKNCIIHDIEYIALEIGENCIAEGNVIHNCSGDRAIELGPGAIFKNNKAYDFRGMIGILAAAPGSIIEYNTIGGSAGSYGNNGILIVEHDVIVRYNNIGNEVTLVKNKRTAETK